MAHKSKQREFAVIGLGRFGATIALSLVEHGASVLGIDHDPQIVQGFADHLTHTVSLDSTDEEALREVEIAHFHTVVVAIGSNFEGSVLTTVALKQLGVKNVVCKATTERQAEVLLRIGADRVILPEVEAGQRLALELSAPELIDLIPVSDDYSVAEVRVPDALVECSLGKANLREAFGVNVLAIRRGAQTTISPPPNLVLAEDDILVVLGPDESIDRISSLE